MVIFCIFIFQAVLLLSLPVAYFLDLKRLKSERIVAEKADLISLIIQITPPFPFMLSHGDFGSYNAQDGWIWDRKKLEDCSYKTIVSLYAELRDLQESTIDSRI